MVTDDPSAPGRSPAGAPSPDWCISPGLTPYEPALAKMEARAAAVAAGTAPELVWLLEHPPVYTGGTSAAPGEVIDPRFPVIATGRGGRYTYHGPGQRVGYLVIDLARRGRDVRAFVHALEGWLIAALDRVGVAAFAVDGRVGIWTRDRAGREAKVGAIGVRVKRWVTLHGFSLNVAPDLSHFAGIVPCGLAEHPVTSLAALGVDADMATVDTALRETLPAFLRSFSSAPEIEG